MHDLNSGITDELAARVNSLAEAERELYDRKRASEEAQIDSAQHLGRIRTDLQQLTADLSQERADRKAADDENMAYTKKMDRRNFVLSIIGVASGVVATIISVLTFLFR